ncbi:MAG: DUF4296 domain-containing protein [Mucilaginibacter sp.]
MHKYKALFFSVMLFLVACGGDKIPDNVIEQDRMTGLLTELHIVDGSMYSVMQMPDSLYKYGYGKYLGLFKKYNTDSVEFKRSMKFYSSHPELLQKIYDQVTINLKTKSDSVTKLYNLQVAKDSKRMADSLKKIQKNQPPKPPAPVQQPPIQKHRDRALKKRKVDAIP